MHSRHVVEEASPVATTTLRQGASCARSEVGRSLAEEDMLHEMSTT